jgi:hypothetical protein
MPGLARQTGGRPFEFPDPAKFEGTDEQKRAFFAKVYGLINSALSISVSLRPERSNPLCVNKGLPPSAKQSKSLALNRAAPD